MGVLYVMHKGEIQGGHYMFFVIGEIRCRALSGGLVCHA